MRRALLAFTALVLFALGAAARAGEAPEAAPEAAPSKPGPFTFIQLCDPQGNWPNFKRAVAQINDLDPAPDFVLICGDMLQSCTKVEQFDEFNEINAGFEVPVHCAPGNHDMWSPTEKLLERYRKHFGPDYYSFNHKGFAFVAINTQYWHKNFKGDSKEHDDWLAKTIEEAAEKKLRIVVFGHYPAYLKTPEDKPYDYHIPPEPRARLLDLFEKHGVAAYLTGHTHYNLEHEYKGTLLVTTTATSFGKGLGFRVWTVGEDGALAHEFVKLRPEEKAPEPKANP